jgi:hypothetical protein
MTFGKDSLSMKESFARAFASNWDNWGYLITLTGPCQGWFCDFRQELTGCQKQLRLKFVQVAEIIGDAGKLLMDLVMTFHQATGVKVVWNHPFYSYLKSCCNTEEEGSDDLYYTPEYALQYAPGNLIIQWNIVLWTFLKPLISLVFRI